MKTQLLILFLAASVIAGGGGPINIPLVGCYCDDNSRVQFDVLRVGATYQLTNLQGDFVDVTMIGGNDSRLAPLPDKSTIIFTATAPVMEIRCRGHQGERVDLRLQLIQPMARANSKQPPAQ